MEATREKAQARLMPLLRAGEIPIVTGFNGATVDGRPTTLGRGGSDFSASILAAALDATELWIWTDVDGIMTADPAAGAGRAAILDEITYSEAAELAYDGRQGAASAHAGAAGRAAAFRSGARTASRRKSRARASCRSSSGGQPGARAVTSMANVALVSLEPASAAVERRADHGARARCAGPGERGDSGDLQFQLPAEFLLPGPRRRNSTRPLEAIEVGPGARTGARLRQRRSKWTRTSACWRWWAKGCADSPGLAGRIFTAISREKVNIIAIAQGSSELTISIVVRRDGLEKAVRAVHAECHL